MSTPPRDPGEPDDGPRGDERTPEPGGDGDPRVPDEPRDVEPSRDADELRGVELPASDAGADASATARAAVDEDDDALPARGGKGRWVLALLLVVALLIPLSGVFLDEVDFGRSAGEVEAQLGSGDPLLDAVVMVRTVQCNGQVTTGSAFALEVDGEVVVLTNRHVVEGANSVGVRPLSGGSLDRVSSTEVSRDRDVAVLTLGPNAPEVTPLQPAEVIPNDTSVQIVGFPGGRPAVNDGTLREQVGERLLLDVSVQQGSSGSPVVDDDGLVVGQVTSRTDDGRGIALRVSEVMEATRSTVPLSGC